MSLLDRLLGKAQPVPPQTALYARAVEVARRPEWYMAGAVPDTLDGRFDMVALVTALLLLRLEREDLAQESVNLTERFIDDMDGSLREIGVGDMVVGKHVGRMVSALGGRLGAYREALEPVPDRARLEAALTRNLYRGESPGPEALGWMADATLVLRERIEAVPLAPLIAGETAL